MRASSLLFLVPGLLLAITSSELIGQESVGPTPPARTDTVTRKSYDIPAQPLEQALDAFRQQSGLKVETGGASFVGVQSYALAGTHSGPEALRLMLTATGLRAHFVDWETAVVQDAAAPAPAPLRPVRIVAIPRVAYAASRTTTATRTMTPLRDVPHSISIITRDLMRDLSMQGMGDVVRFVPGVTMGQGEGNRDQPTIRGNNTTADFFVDGVRDDVQYFRDLYNTERVEALKGSNAMTFGRGGGGGVLNRVTKEAAWTPLREMTLQGGSFDNKRASIDVGDGVSSTVATRFNGMFERSGRFRDDVSLERYGLNPTITLAPAARRARIVLGYELFADRRTADRGIPSFEGRPVATDISTFFGDPEASYSRVRSHVGTATVTYDAREGLAIRNRTQVGSYDKFYQNVFPGAVNTAGDRVSISAYNNDTQRLNVFNQTDVTLDARTGPITHTLLVGAEAGRQATDNLRLTGFFDNTTTTVSAPVADPTISAPLTFRPGSTDADNAVTNTVGSLYVQDQIAISSNWQLIAGVRYERFDIEVHNNRTDSTLRRADDLISPRAGVIFKPIQTLSFYASQSLSYLPSSGDQFSSLTDVTKALEPERFDNRELGAKWDVRDRIAMTGAFYRLDRTNSRAPHPTDPAKSVQTGSQRTSGWELGINGNVTQHWDIVAAYANQRATITRTTSAAVAGSKVPLVPRTTLSVWNRFQPLPSLGFGLGVVNRADMYAAIDQKVTLPGYTEVDAAVFLRLGRHLRAQANVENLFDVDHYDTAHSNNNISPGSPRAVRVTFTAGF